MNNDTFEYHLERAIESLLKQNNIDIKSYPTLAENFVKERIYTIINNNINQAINNLLTK
jgi:hypothetical protein